jgi:acyl dehydratase
MRRRSFQEYTMSIQELTASPSTLSLYSRAVLGSLAGKKGGDSLPDTELQLNGLQIDRDQLAAYNRVCGFAQRETIPATFPFILAFPLHMSLITAPEFPFAAMGLVHIQNSITQHRPIKASEALNIRVRFGALRPHDKGLQFSILTEVRVGSELVWDSESTMLKRTATGGKSEPKAAPTAKAAPAPANVVWSIPGDIGRRYGAVSGDRNPIHLYAFTAKLFGFPRAIAHGMWTKARCLAALDGRLPDAYTVDVQFKLPVLLPAKVAFNSEPTKTGFEFGVSDARSGKPHLAGQVTTV